MARAQDTNQVGEAAVKTVREKCSQKGESTEVHRGKVSLKCGEDRGCLEVPWVLHNHASQ